MPQGGTTKKPLFFWLAAKQKRQKRREGNMAKRHELWPSELMR